MELDNDYDDILVPVDGSKNANLAFKRAVGMAKEYHAELHIINVIDEDALNSMSAISFDDINKLTNHNKSNLDKKVQIAKRYGVKADSEIDTGSPRVEIAHELVKKFNTDLIVMGANGKNAVERVLIGSVASYVSRVAPCDVLLVKEQE